MEKKTSFLQSALNQPRTSSVYIQACEYAKQRSAKQMLYSWTNRPEKADPCVATMTFESSVNCVAMCAEDQIACAGVSDDLSLWDLVGCVVFIVVYYRCLLFAFVVVYFFVFCFFLDFNALFSVTTTIPHVLFSYQQKEQEQQFVFSTHNKVVSCDIASTFGKTTAVSGHKDGSLLVWDVLSRSKQHTLKGHTAAINECCLFDEGRALVTASDDETVKVWSLAGDTPESMQRHSFALGSAVKSLAVCAVAHKAVVTLKDSNIVALDLSDMHEISRSKSKHTATVSGCALTQHDGKIVAATCSHDKTLRVWDYEILAEFGILRGHSGSVRCCCFSADGSLLLSGSEDCTIRVWQWQLGQVLKCFSGHSRSVLCIRADSQAALALTGSRDMMLKVWNIGSDTAADHHQQQQQQQASASASVSDGGSSSTASASASAAAATAASASSSSASSISPTSPTAVGEVSPNRHSASLLACTITQAAPYLGVTTGLDGSLAFWDVRSGKRLQKQAASGHTVWILGVDINADASLLVTACWDTTLSVIDLATGKPVRRLEGHSDGVYDCRFTPNSHYVVSASKDKTLKLWDSRTGACRGTFLGHTDCVNCCDIAPAGDLVASGSKDASLRLWAISRCKLLHIFSDHTKSVESCRFSPRGDTLASSSLDGNIFIYCVVQHSLLRALTGHNSPVVDLAYNTSGSRLYSISKDGCIKVWACGAMALFSANGGVPSLPSAASSSSSSSIATTSSSSTASSSQLSGASSSLSSASTHAVASWSIPSVNLSLLSSSSSSSTSSSTMTFDSTGVASSSSSSLHASSEQLRPPSPPLSSSQSLSQQLSQQSTTTVHASPVEQPLASMVFSTCALQCIAVATDGERDLAIVGDNSGNVTLFESILAVSTS